MEKKEEKLKREDFTAEWTSPRTADSPKVVAGKTYPAYYSVTGETWIIDEENKVQHIGFFI